MPVGSWKEVEVKVLTAEKAEHKTSEHIVFVCLPGIIPRNLIILTQLSLEPPRVEAVINILTL